MHVAVLAFDGISPFHMAVPLLVFGSVGIDGVPGSYDVVVCAEEPGDLMTAGGYTITVDAGLEAFRSVDIVTIPGWPVGQEPSQKLLAAVRAAHLHGARIVGLCLGSIVVAASGIANGREIATHWAVAEWLTGAYPDVIVRPNVLWSDLGDVVTSAGVAAALDTCLHVLRSDYGSEAATTLARLMVLAPHRAGSQAQFIPNPIAKNALSDLTENAMTWARENLATRFDLDDWAAAVHTSRRTLSRRFRERTGSSPQQWLLVQRVDRARSLLETGGSSIEEVARESGFGSAVSLRHHFRAHLGVSPAEHRAQFAGQR